MAQCPRCGGHYSQEELLSHLCVEEVPAWKVKGAPYVGPSSKVVIVLGALLLLRDAYAFFFQGSAKVPFFGLGFILIIVGYIALRLFALPYEP
jgi:hypothetical protein